MTDAGHDVFSDRQLRHDLIGQINAMKLMVECLVRGMPADPAEAVGLLDDLIRAAEGAERILEGRMG